MKKAFSLIELVLVLFVLSTLAILALPSADDNQAELDMAAQRLRSDLRYAQELAMTHDSAFGFNALTATTYEIFDGAAGNPAIDPLTSQNYGVDFTDFSRRVVFQGTPPVITYSSDGSPASSGGLNIVLTDGTNSRTITITQNTGMVVIN